MPDHTTRCHGLKQTDVTVARLEEQMKTAFANISHNEQATRRDIQALRDDVHRLTNMLEANRAADERRRAENEKMYRKAGMWMISMLGAGVIGLGVYVFQIKTGG